MWLTPWLVKPTEYVGDLGQETIALILPPPAASGDLPLHGCAATATTRCARPMRRCSANSCWLAQAGLGAVERFVFNKLITGGFRAGVSALLVQRALAQVSGVDARVIAHHAVPATGRRRRRTTAVSFRPMAAASGQVGRHPFSCPSGGGEPDKPGGIGDWRAEWRWDGIRGQLVKRAAGVSLVAWRADAAQFPEIVAAASTATLPDCVLDGEVLAARDGRVLPFSALQKRLGRNNPGRKILADTPAIFYFRPAVAGELATGRHQRRQDLHGLLYSLPLSDPRQVVLQLSDIVRAPSWETLAQARQQSRARGTEGLMLKRRESAYGVGRTRGDWWKWKVDALTIDCVLMYAQRGHGKRASLYTDYTFGVWSSQAVPAAAAVGDGQVDGNAGSNSSIGADSSGKMAGKPRQLVTFAKAYSGLSDSEITEVDAFIRRNTLEKFGPVRTVKPGLVFELAFEGIQRSARHKSGVAVRFPRMARIRRDKKIEEADSLDTILHMLDTMSKP